MTTDDPTFSLASYASYRRGHGIGNGTTEDFERYLGGLEWNASLLGANPPAVQWSAFFLHRGICFTAYQLLDTPEIVVLGTVYQLFLIRLSSTLDRDDDSGVIVAMGYEVFLGDLKRKLREVRDWPPQPSGTGVSLVFGTTANLGHYFWNEVTGLDLLDRANLLERIDHIWVGSHDYLGLVSRAWLRRHRISSSRLPPQDNLRCTSVVVRMADVIQTEASCRRVMVFCRMHQGFFGGTSKKPHSGPRIAIQVRSHARRWLSEATGLPCLVRAIRAEFPRAEFLLEGFSKAPRQSVPDSICVKSDRRLVHSVLKTLGYPSYVKSVVGKPLKTKILALAEVDLVIGPIGSAGLLTNWILKKPLIQYGPPAYYSWTQKDAESKVEGYRAAVHYVPSEAITISGSDFDLSWESIWQVVMEHRHHLDYTVASADGSTTFQESL